MWNDTDIPLAFLITFRSYGTWLHGDERGSVSRFRNQYKSARLPPEERWLRTNTQRLKGEIVVLDATQRQCVDEATRETCHVRGWHLYAINVRTNHVHVVVAIGEKDLRLPSTLSKQTRHERCARMAAGRAIAARGPIREVSDISGPSAH